MALYLKVLCLAVWDALSVLALPPLIALGVVSHGSGGRTGGLVARAHRLLLAGGVVVRPALGALGHEVAADATRRILVRALGVGPQLAILITALVVGVRYGQLSNESRINTTCSDLSYRNTSK